MDKPLVYVYVDSQSFVSIEGHEPKKKQVETKKLKPVAHITPSFIVIISSR